MGDSEQREQIAGIQEVIERLTSAEQAARTPEKAQRLASLRHQAERSLEQEEARSRRELLLDCPSCNVPGDLANGVCPHCGRRVDEIAVYVTTGIWRVHVTFLTVFWALAVGLARTAAHGSMWVALRIVAGIGAPACIVLGLPYFFHTVRLLSWLWRRRRKA